MYVFNVKLYEECHEDKKGIKKAVTRLVSASVSLISCKCIPVSLISCEMA